MSTIIDNIIIGVPIADLDAMGILPDDNTVRLSFDEVTNDKGNVFLPAVLKTVGVFDSTSQAKQVNEQRKKSDKITDPLSKNIWRNIEGPEFTYFKIGKRVFWLLVGQPSDP